MPAQLEQLEIIVIAEMQKVITNLITDLETRVVTMTAAGMERAAAIAILQNDLSTGGITFGTYKNGMKNLVSNAVRGAANEAMLNEFATTNVELWRWVTVSGNPCLQCLDRQGDLQTLEFWQAAGLPKSGFSICLNNCKCVLLPEGFESPELHESGFLVTV